SAHAPTSLTNAKTHATNAVNHLLAAVTAIQGRTDTTTTNHLITLNATEIASTTSRLNEVNSSFSASTGIKDEFNVVKMYLNLSKLYDGIGLRAVLPPFVGTKLGGLFPDPTMGGIFPDDKYNFAGDSLNQDSNSDGIPDILQSSPKQYVSTATITVDGNATDWAGIQSVVIDPANDITNYNNPTPLADATPYGAADFHRLFVARDSSNVYLRFERASDVMPAGFTATYSVTFTALNTPSLDTTYVYLSGSSVNCYQNSQTFTPASYVASGQTVEISCPLTAFKNLTGDYRVAIYSSVWKNNPYIEVNDYAYLANLTFGDKPALASGGGTATPLSVTSTTLSLNVGGNASLTASGGTAPYIFDAGGSSVFTLDSGTSATRTVTCAQAGSATLLVKDNAAHSVPVSVTCNAVVQSLTANPDSLSLNVGTSSTVLFSGGSGSYSIHVDNSGVISLGVITGTSAEVHCMKAGSSTLGVSDTASHTASVPVTCNTVAPTTLTLDPVNLTVNSGTRAFSFPTGTTVAVQTGADVISGSATGVSCLKAGSATVKITIPSSNSEGTTTVNCVAAVPEVTSTDTSRWVFPTPDITMVNHARATMKTGTAANIPEYYLDYTRTGGTTTLHDRTVSIQATSWGEIYYTMDANGLTFHGEQHNNAASSMAMRTIDFGLMNAPNLSTAGVVSTDLLSTNLTTPSVRIPKNLTSGITSPQYVVQFAINPTTGAPDYSQWTLIKTEVTVEPNINLLAATPPTELANDTFFTHWRDSITNPDLLSKVSRVAHIRLVVSRYTAFGVTTPASQHTTHVYQALDLGTVYEITNSSEISYKAGLTAMVTRPLTTDLASDPSSLKSLTTDQVKLRKVRITSTDNNPLNNAFVWTRGDHTIGTFASSPHAHNAASLLNETPNTSVATFTLFNRLNPPDSDRIDSLNVTYGATGYVTKSDTVQTATIPNPQELTLSPVSQPVVAPGGSSSSVRSAGFFQYSELPPVVTMATIHLPAVNLSVGTTNYRPLNLPTVLGTFALGTPEFSVPDTASTMLELSPDKTGVKCLLEGSTQVGITLKSQDGTPVAQASVTINCVAKATPDTSVSLPEWLFPQDTTLVTHARWQAATTSTTNPSSYDESLQPSRAHGTTTWYGRNVLVNHTDEGGQEFYTLDATHGLTFHGEKRYDQGRKEQVQTVNFGFIPNAEFATSGVTEADLTSRADPAVLVPGTLTGDYTNTNYTLRYELDEAGNIKSDKWSVIKTDISINGNVNLLSANPPSEFYSTTDGSVDGYFTSWRDSITDQELLKELTHAIHVTVVETRYQALGTPGVAQTNHIYLVKGLGVAYERNKESDGIWKGALWAVVDPQGNLKSFTQTGVKTRSIELKGPQGAVLNNPYVVMHAAHTQGFDPPHTHNAHAGYLASESVGNLAKFVVFNRLNPPESDLVSRWNVTYGADGYQAKSTQVDTADSYLFELMSTDQINPSSTSLTVTDTSVSLTVGASKSIGISGGTPNYQVSSSNSAAIGVSNITATGATVTCNAVGNGTVTVSDAGTQLVPVSVTCTASTSGGGGTTNTLTLSPINLSVGDVARSLKPIDTTAPTPVLTVVSGNDVLQVLSGANAEIKCLQEGSATLGVTVNNLTGNTTVTCVAPAAADTSVSIADWLFPANTTLVSHGRWQPNVSTSDNTLQLSMQASLAQGSASLHDHLLSQERAVSVERYSDGESYYTMDTTNGLIFHGEKRFDAWQNRTSRQINYGFKVDPNENTTDPATVLTATNLDLPKPMVPGTLSGETTRTLYTASFELDADNMPMTSKWAITKTEISLTPNVNLLAPVPPVDLLSGKEYFIHWRDSITDADLLKAATHALYVKLVETRYQPGSDTPQPHTNHVFLVKGFGQVFEYNEESDGKWFGALRATITGTEHTLKSLTTDQVLVRKVEIDGPTGLTLNNVYLQAHAEHDASTTLPKHGHNLNGWFIGQPTTSSAQFALFMRVNPPANDKVEEWHMTYGATGYARKSVEVETATMADPHILTLLSEDQGIDKTFRVNLADGTPVKGGNIQIQRYDSANSRCVEGSGNYFNLADDGKVTVTLTAGTHCVGVWPNNNSAAFTGGWYDSTVVSGTVNVKSQLTNAASFVVSISSGELALIVAPGSGGGGGTSGNVTISGTITDGTNPLANVTITAIPLTGAVSMTQSNATGGYSLTLPAGSYVLKFGYTGQDYTAVAYVQSFTAAGTILSPAASTPALSYQTNVTLPEVNLTSAYHTGGGTGGGGSGGTSTIIISGKVSNAKGGMKGIQVEFQPDWSNNTGHLESVMEKTGDTGDYSAAIKPGKYRVQFRAEYWDNTTGKMVNIPGVLGWGGYADGDGKTTEMYDQAEVFNFTEATTVNALMSSGIQVSGIVKDASDNPVKGVQVELQPDWESGSNSAVWKNTITADDGSYSIFVSKGSVYRVYFNTNYDVWQNQTQTHVKLPGLGGYSTGTENSAVDGRMDSAKKYEFQADTVVNAKLIAGITIRGKVTSEGMPLENIPVSFQPEWDAETNSYGVWGNARTDSQGQYSFDAQPGKYRIEIPNSTWRWDQNPPVEEKLPNGLVGGFADGLGHVTQEWSSAKVFEVRATTTVDMDLVKGITLKGTVVQSDGSPVKGAMVNVHTQDWNSNFHQSSGDDGSFTVTVIPGKEYKVEVWPPYCETTAYPATQQGCDAAVKFQGGSWITPPKAKWVTRWVESEHDSRPLVTASKVPNEVLSHENINGKDPGVVPGMVMSQWDEHLVTNILMDQSLTIGIMVDAGKPIHGRVVDGLNPVPYAWVNTPFGGTSTDQEGYFTLNLPSVNLAQGVDNTFDINIYPGGHQEQGMWMPGSGFMGGVVVRDETDGFTLSNDWAQAVHFEKDLKKDSEIEVDWPTKDIGNNRTGLLVSVSKGLEIKGLVKGNDQPLANVWVNAWSHEARQGGGQSSDSNGQYAIQIPKPAAGKSVLYEVNLWTELFLPPDPVLVEVGSTGVTGVFKRAKDKFIEDEDGFYRPAKGDPILPATQDRAGFVDFSLSSGKTIKGRVTDGENNGLAWIWVDVHTRDGSQWYGANT
ncbi:MAG: carboxypeptidase regulatory-like domain-containing protein, partial [Magnetococcus sp. YQC-9]